MDKKQKFSKELKQLLEKYNVCISYYNGNIDIDYWTKNGNFKSSEILVKNSGTITPEDL